MTHSLSRGRVLPWYRLAAIVAVAAACGMDSPDAEFQLEVLATESVAQVDSLPGPQVRVDGDRVVIEAVFGLGSSGYQLIPSGSAGDGVVDLLVTARMPEGSAGLTVLTAYRYRVTSSPLAAGTWLVRLRQAMDDEGNPELILEREVRVGG